MENPRLAAVLSAFALLAAADPARAQPVPAGTDIAVNDFTTGVQRAPRLTTLANGGFVVVWHSDGQDGDGYAVQGRRYDAAGAPIGGEFQVNTYTTGRQYGPFVAADRKGNFVVVWNSDGQDGDLYGTFGQRYDAAGNRAGAEFAINTHTTGYQAPTDAAFDDAGRFTVVWTSTDNEDGDGNSVHAQRFAPGGARLGAELLVNTTTAGSQFSPSVAMRPDGAFVVVWLTPDAVGFGVVGQRFASDGARVGGEFVVNDTTTGDPRFPRVKMVESGDFVVSWNETDGSNRGVFARRFAASAAPLGPRFQVNSYTTGTQSGDLAINAVGDFALGWFGASDGNGSGIGGRRYTAGGTPRDGEFVVNAYTTGNQSTAAIASDDVGNLVVAWTDTSRDGSGDGVFARRLGGLRPSALAADTTGNGVLQPNETAVLAPSWRNRNGAAQAFGGTLAFTGPAGPAYAVPDGVATYGTVADGGAGSCSDCYAVSITGASRPASHWDAIATEAITPDALGQRKAWRVHVGDSFADVPAVNPFYRFIETLLHHQVTGGCSGSTYCPSSATTREQMAVFVLVAREGAAYAPPACATPVFADVPASSGFCRWIEELARRSVVGGCGGGNYCPGAPVTREQMAVFALRTLDPGLNPPACTPPNLYADVPETSGFCRWVEELTARGVVSGCGGGNYCPLAAVTREQMGVFLGVTFGLTLYGP